MADESIREFVIKIVAEVLGIPSQNINNETLLQNDQCNAVALQICVRTGRPLRIDDFSGTTVKKLIAAYEEG